MIIDSLSGPLDENVSEAIKKGNLVCCGVLSGNRNFEGRIHPDTRANYLASPPLVIAYAIAGRIDIDFETEPVRLFLHLHPLTPLNCNILLIDHSIHISQLGHNSENKPVFLRDIWPKRDELQAVEKKFVIPRLFQEVYSKITTGNERWNKLEVPLGQNYEWEGASTYIKRPPFFEGQKPMSLQRNVGNNVALLMNNSAIILGEI